MKTTRIHRLINVLEKISKGNVKRSGGGLSVVGIAPRGISYAEAMSKR